MSRTIQRYGWKPSLPDHRDLKADLEGLALLPEVDPRLSPAMPDIFNQGQLGSCTANAVSAAIAYDYRLDNPSFTRHPSRLFVYYTERELEGTLGQGDTGAMGRDGFKGAAKWGWVPEIEWPYVISKYQDDPSGGVWADAATNKLVKPYVSVPQNQESIQAVLSNNQTVAFGFTVYESFESNAVAESGIVPMPKKNESQLGGHETLIVGYLESEPEYALVRNSWGASWGLAGYFLMPWAYITSSSLASDLRTIVRSAV